MPTSGADEVSFEIYSPIGRSDFPGLCQRVCALLSQSDAPVAICDVAGVPADAVTVDALARLQLAARRCERRVLLRNAEHELLQLVAFMGLAEVLADR